MSILFILSLWCGHYAHAVDVAFVEIHDRHGKPSELEPGGRFMHVAIRIGGRWLHAHSRAGVEMFDEIESVGDHAVILRNRTVREPEWAEYQHWLGKPFDFHYSWTNPKATYCTRLVAELLGVEPKPMEFKSEIWRDHLYRDEALGAPGLSPDDLFATLLARGYRPVLDCARRLEKAL